MKDIFVESVNSYQGLDDIRKDAIISLYRTLFEADDKKDEKKDDKKGEEKTPDIEDAASEDWPCLVKRNMSPINVTPAPNREVKYIALHYTAGNSSAPGSASRTVFPGNCSADFIVDDGEIYQFNPDLDKYYTHAVGVEKQDLEKYKETAKIGGAAALYGTAKNSNTISIEMCSNFKGKRPEGVSPYDRRFSLSEETLANTAALVAYLLKRYPGVQVVRHFDITGKPCPAPWCWDDEGNQKYYEFVQRCNATPAPGDPNYKNVDDAMEPKDNAPPWPDFGSQFAPDKTATTAANLAQDGALGGTLGGFLQSITTPAGKVLANIITKNNGQVPKSVVKDFVEMVAKNPEMMKNVLKLVPKK